VPYFGICLGMQIAVIEYARNVMGIADANSGEFAPDCPHKVIDFMPGQSEEIDKGGTLRLGSYPCAVVPGSTMERCYGTLEIAERHRHRYEFNNDYRQAMQAAGLTIGGTSPDGRLVETVELTERPFYVGVQFHPEFKSRPNRPHPLFCGFIAAALEHARMGTGAEKLQKKVHCTKMHGLGNDYLYFYGEQQQPEELARKLSHRHFGVGADGIIIISPSAKADFRMRIFNADGSEAMMCGNGIRCVGKYVFDKGYTDKQNLTIETNSGIKEVQLHLCGGMVEAATVNMGKSTVSPPIRLSTAWGDVEAVPVSMGNPHAVIFTDSAADAPLDTVGKELEHHASFPQGVNVEFVQVLDAHTLRMRVWERGSGITMACGTGSCASAAAAVWAGYCQAEEEITVILDGGSLGIQVMGDATIMMRGPAATVCECEVDFSCM
jgi:diaminopimelate epimerase